MLLKSKTAELSVSRNYTTWTFCINAFKNKTAELSQTDVTYQCVDTIITLAVASQHTWQSVFCDLVSSSAQPHTICTHTQWQPLEYVSPSCGYVLLPLFGMSYHNKGKQCGMLHVKQNASWVVILWWTFYHSSTHARGPGTRHDRLHAWAVRSVEDISCHKFYRHV